MTDSNKPEENKATQAEDLLMDHEYDGIQEYDNPLPRWWVWIFWGTFFFAIGYFVHYHVTHTGQSVLAEYQEEVAAAKASAPPEWAPVAEAELAALMKQPDAVSAGKSVFDTRCMPCHGDKAQGVVGPNLTDNSWIHGDGKLEDLFKVVSEGVAAKGMPEWRRQLSRDEVMKVVAFIGTLRGTKVAGKPPEGREVNGY
jgi:cytochrome c oxidase cbb3-type subunit III